MRFISIREAAGRAQATAARFPLVLLAAAVAMVVAQLMVEWRGEDLTPWRFLLPALLAIPLLTAIQTTGERARSARSRSLAAGAFAVLLLATFGFVSRDWSQTILFTRAAQLVVAFHLMVAVLPFLGTPANRAFWQYNRLLFIRFLIATLFAAVLFAGLAIAIVAIDNLFGVNIDDEMYARLWIMIAFVFHPWFFLSGVPTDLDALEDRTDYPAGLKVFAQFILIPVVTVYLLILSAYLVRVLVTRTWPSGWIGWLVSSVSAAGTLALLLVHPVRERADSRWVDAYGRWFYVALLPSIAMLLMAIWQRVEQYGFTERRYFLAILALWLAAVALYYAITASRNIRVIPVTLCAVALATFMGPWSAYAVAQRSQGQRLRDLLERNEILVEGRLQRPPADVPFEDSREISAVVRYLVDTHGARALRHTSVELQQAAAEAAPADPAQTVDDPVGHAVLERIGIRYVSRWESQPQPEYINYQASPYNVPVAIEGFDVLVRAYLTQPFTVAVGADTLAFAWVQSPPGLDVQLRGERIMAISLTDVLAEVRALMRPGPTGPRAPEPNQPRPSAEAEGAGFRVRLLLFSLAGQDPPAGPNLSHVEADVLIGQSRR
jgi:hypothetical protein